MSTIQITESNTTIKQRAINLEIIIHTEICMCRLRGGLRIPSALTIGRRVGESGVIRVHNLRIRD